MHGTVSPGDDLASRELVWPWDALYSTVLGLDQKGLSSGQQLPVNKCNLLQFSSLPILIPGQPLP